MRGSGSPATSPVSTSYKKMPSVSASASSKRSAHNAKPREGRQRRDQPRFRPLEGPVETANVWPRPLRPEPRRSWTR